MIYWTVFDLRRAVRKAEERRTARRMRVQERRTVRMKRRAQRKLKRNRISMPNQAIYTVACGVMKARLDNFNVNIIREDMGDIKPPFVVLANHGSKQDWIFVGAGMFPDLLNIVITTYYYSKPKLRTLLRLMGTIPKDQFAPDVSAIKNILSVADRGGNIMLFPEGRTTPSGESETFERSTVKLLRRLNRPVIGIHFDGFYLTMPKWNDNPRRGRVDMRIFPMFTPEQMKGMSDDEIYDRMVSSLYTDEYAWQKKNRVEFEGGDCAEGLHNILFMCPKCGAEMTTVTSGDTISCSACRNGARLNKFYDLIPLDEECVIPETISEWYKWQVAQQRRAAEENPDLKYTGKVQLQRIVDSKKWLQPVGEGTLTLDREGFHYDGTDSGEQIKLDIPLSMLPAIAFDPGKSFELYYRGVFYSFELEQGQSSQKWSMLTEQMHNVHCGDR